MVVVKAYVPPRNTVLSQAAQSHRRRRKAIVSRGVV